MAADAPLRTAGQFDALYLGARDRLASQIHALTGDWPASRDVVQEAFVRAWIHWDRVAGYQDPEGWVRRVAYNLAKSRWRRSRRSLLAADPPEPAAGTTDADPTAHADLIAALAALSDRERVAIALHHLAGLSVEETAAEMAAPAGSVKSWLSRGRTHLAVAMAANARHEEESHG